MLLIINEQHSLFKEQKEMLENYDYETIKVPSIGWTLDEQKQVVQDLMEVMNTKHHVLVFASPVPYLLKMMSLLSAEDNFITLVFHNDNREKLELPNGKIIHKVAKTGWQLG